jgi:hypothetical protein
MRQSLLFLLFVVALLSACQPVDIPPIVQEDRYHIIINNPQNDPSIKWGAWLSNESGQVLAFRWLEAADSTILFLRDHYEGEFTCNLMKMTVNQTAIGPDTSIEFSTYERLGKGTQIYLNESTYLRYTDFQVRLLGVTSLDSIVVPDGFIFARPQASNNYQGLYRVRNSGSLWIRLKANGDPRWRYATFKHLQGSTLEATLDVSQLPTLSQQQAKTILLPYYANWKHDEQGVIRMDERHFLPIGDQQPTLGSPVTVRDRFTVYQPADETFDGYRLTLSGADINLSDGTIFYYDKFTPTMPNVVSLPEFDVEPTLVSDNRVVSFRTNGSTSDIDAITITRSNYNTQPRIQWKVVLSPEPRGGSATLVHKLPDLPQQISAIVTSQRAYNFGGLSKVRAEAYDKIEGYEALQKAIFEAKDPLWVPKAGYTAKEKTF